jgi:hypothetical protein
MDTPKTDEIWVEHRGTLAEYFEKLLEHSRQLERELAEARQQRDTLVDALSYVVSCGYDGPLPEYARDKTQLALAAVKGEKP